MDINNNVSERTQDCKHLSLLLDANLAQQYLYLFCLSYCSDSCQNGQLESHNRLYNSNSGNNNDFAEKWLPHFDWAKIDASRDAATTIDVYELQQLYV